MDAGAAVAREQASPGQASEKRVEFDRRVGAANALLEQMQRCLYEAGVHVKFVIDNDLHREAGYDSGRDFILGAIEASERLVRRAIGYVEHHASGEVTQLGALKVDALATLREVAGAAAVEEAGATIDLVDPEGEVSAIPLVEATSKQIREASRRIRQAKTAARRMARVNDSDPGPDASVSEAAHALGIRIRSALGGAGLDPESLSWKYVRDRGVYDFSLSFLQRNANLVLQTAANASIPPSGDVGRRD
jgi:hypothetical protein